MLALLLGLAGLRIDASHAGQTILPVTLGIATALARPWIRNPGEARLADLAECWGLMTLFCTMGALASYAITRLGSGEVDAWLATVDRAIGFDWISAYRFVAARPFFARVSEIAYLSIFATPVVLLAALTLSGRADRARALIAAFGLALAVTLAIFSFFPARSALAYYMGNDVGYMPATGISHLDAIDRLRSGALTVIDIASLSGMITFPSFHAVAAILFIWAAWPLAWLRLPCLAVNLTMLAATPVQGTHYLVDVIGGVAVALATLRVLHIPLLRSLIRFSWPLGRGPALG